MFTSEAIGGPFSLAEGRFRPHVMTTGPNATGFILNAMNPMAVSAVGLDMTSIRTQKLSNHHRKTAPLVGASVFLVCAAVLSGCGKTVSVGDAAQGSTSAAPTSSSAPADPDGVVQVLDGTAEQNGKTGNGGTVTGNATQQNPPEWVQLSATTTPALNGPHVVNINGASLYRFDKDVKGADKSNCNGDCAKTWPPVTIQDGANVYLDGVDRKQVGAFRRQDGGIQLTVGGWAVYRYSGDAAAGDINGEGVGGTWFAVGPEGQKVMAASSQSTKAPEPQQYPRQEPAQQQYPHEQEAAQYPQEQPKPGPQYPQQQKSNQHYPQPKSNQQYPQQQPKPAQQNPKYSY
jgi:predicted lipoprotein with Yx(FWY)xxD motif